MAGAKKRNAERRERYASDAEYRKQRVLASRQAYRDKTQVATPDLSNAIGKLRNTGTRRAVFIGVRMSRRKTWTTTDLADIVGRHVQVVYRWIKNGHLPGPRFNCAEGENQHREVYVREEMVAMLSVLRDHFSRTAYLRMDHDETISALHSAVALARRELMTNA